MTRMPINRKYHRQSPHGGEAGFTLIEMVIVIVLVSVMGTFIFQILTKSLNAQIVMQKRKERGDDAVLTLEKISREAREAKELYSASSNLLVFKRADTGQVVKYIRNTSTNRIRRQSAATLGGLPSNSTSGNIVAENVTSFSVSVQSGTNPNTYIINMNMQFASGSEWMTKLYPRNYGL